MTKLNLVASYCRNLKVRQEATYRITPEGQVLVLYKGAAIPEKDFHEMFPLNAIKKTRPDIDGRRNGLTGLPTIRKWER